MHSPSRRNQSKNWFLLDLICKIIYSFLVEIKFSLKGRATRSEWSLWKLIMVLVCLAIQFIIKAFDPKKLPPDYKIILSAFHIVLLIIYVTILLVDISFDVRRLHDIDFSGWWVLLNFIPFVYFGFFFILAIKKGTQGPNSFGEDPLQKKQCDEKSNDCSCLKP